MDNMVNRDHNAPDACGCGLHRLRDPDGRNNRGKPNTGNCRDLRADMDGDRGSHIHRFPYGGCVLFRPALPMYGPAAGRAVRCKGMRHGPARRLDAADLNADTPIYR